MPTVSWRTRSSTVVSMPGYLEVAIGDASWWKAGTLAGTDVNPQLQAVVVINQTVARRPLARRESPIGKIANAGGSGCSR